MNVSEGQLSHHPPSCWCNWKPGHASGCRDAEGKQHPVMFWIIEYDRSANAGESQPTNDRTEERQQQGESK